MAPRARVLRVEADVAGASVFLDREFVGQVPLELRDVEAGSHTIQVSAEGLPPHSQQLTVGRDPQVVSVRLREVHLAESVDVIHKHAVGSCRGRLRASLSGLAFDATGGQDSFALPLASLERFQVDYLEKNLRIVGGGRTYNFTTDAPNADALLVFLRRVNAARERL